MKFTASIILAYITTHGVEKSAETIAANLRHLSGGVTTESTCDPACAANQFCDGGKCYDRLDDH